MKTWTPGGSQTLVTGNYIGTMYNTQGRKTNQRIIYANRNIIIVGKALNMEHIPLHQVSEQLFRMKNKDILRQINMKSKN